jgi:tryptophan synthase alpha chain
MLQRIKAITDLPITVGFGIKDATSAAAIAKVAEGVVIGSALVDRIAQAAQQNQTGSDLYASAAQLIGEIRRAVDAK